MLCQKQDLVRSGAARWTDLKQLNRLQTSAAAGDLVTLLAVYGWLVLGFGVYGSDPIRIATWSVVLAIVWLGFAIRNGLYRLPILRERCRGAYVAAKVTILAGAVFHLIPLVGGPIDSRITSAAVVVVLTIGMVVWRFLLSSLALSTIPDEPVDLLVVGTGAGPQSLARALAARPKPGMRIAAFIELDVSAGSSTPPGLPLVSLAELPSLVRGARRRPRVVLGMGDESRAQVYEELTKLAQSGIEVVGLVSVYEEIAGCIPVWHLGNTWWATLPRASSDLLYVSVKRAIDLAGAVVGLLVLAIVLPVMAPLLRRETGGSVFFRQERVGRDGKVFELLKMRTLPSRPAFSDHWQRKNSNVASAVGDLVRSTGLDELPQCWNVLRGEMSLVGPRPYVPEEVDDFQKKIPFFRSRAQVRPGITGWAQVNWGYGLSIEDEVEKLQYDLYYVGRQSLYLDLLVMLRTFNVLARRRRSQPVAAAEAVVARGVYESGSPG
jgi:lipopolysaccharide/colanic/teichoic acid biosynthesis glycosyltransferase